jgi:hypothetical protein
MLESTLAHAVRFDEAVTAGDPKAMERAAFELIGELDELSQTAGADDAVKLAVLAQAGFLIGVARRHDGDASCWLQAFAAELREAEAMVATLATQRDPIDGAARA